MTCDDTISHRTTISYKTAEAITPLTANYFMMLHKTSTNPLLLILPYSWCQWQKDLSTSSINFTSVVLPTMLMTETCPIICSPAGLTWLLRSARLYSSMLDSRYTDYTENRKLSWYWWQWRLSWCTIFWLVKSCLTLCGPHIFKYVSSILYSLHLVATYHLCLNLLAALCVFLRHEQLEITSTKAYT